MSAMSYLTVFSETGFPHAGTFLEYTFGREWLSFMPKPGELAGGNGFIDTMDRERSIDHYIRYPISDSLLRHARLSVVTDYWTEVYQIGTLDCVSFARAMAKACGMITFGLTLNPKSLVFDLKTYWSGYSHFDVRPFPWHVGDPPESIRYVLAGEWRVTIGNWHGNFVFGAYGSVHWVEAAGSEHHSGRWSETPNSVSWQFDDDPPGFKRTFTISLPLQSVVRGQILPEGQGFFEMVKG